MRHFWTAAIAIGLWASATALWLKPAKAQFEPSMSAYLKSMDDNLRALAKGGPGCSNTKICG